MKSSTSEVNEDQSSAHNEGLFLHHLLHTGGGGFSVSKLELRHSENGTKHMDAQR